MSATIELGSKHECPSCGTKYYDLGKNDAACPKCGSSQEGDDADADKASSKSG